MLSKTDTDDHFYHLPLHKSVEDAEEQTGPLFVCYLLLCILLLTSVAVDKAVGKSMHNSCLLYTSDAADE